MPALRDERFARATRSGKKERPPARIILAGGRVEQSFSPDVLQADLQADLQALELSGCGASRGGSDVTRAKHRHRREAP